MLLTARDITERKRTEQRQQVLTAEVDHRAKNLLAVIQAMLLLVRADDVESYVGAVGGRIQSLARAHTLLADNRWSGADLERLVNDELAPYRTVGDTRVTATGPRVLLSPPAAQVVAMALHELAVNAARHGALTVPEGTVDVSWQRRADGAMVIDWRERGGPPPLPDRTAGFGSLVIGHSVGHQLGGEATLTFGGDGVDCRIVVPAQALAPLPSGRDKSPGAADGTNEIDFARIAGCCILVAEDDPVLALDVEMALKAAACRVLGPVASLAAAVSLVDSEPLDAAVLDIDLNGQSVFPIADLLAARGIPFVVSTGYGAGAAQADHHQGALRLRKPYDRADLLRAISRVLADVDRHDGSGRGT